MKYIVHVRNYGADVPSPFVLAFKLYPLLDGDKLIDEDGDYLSAMPLSKGEFLIEVPDACDDTN